MTYAPPPSGLPDPDLRPDFYAGVASKRLAAWVADLAIVAALTTLGVLLTAFIGLFFLPLIWLVMDFSYRTITLTNRSATWGHRLMGIEFRDRTGRRFDLAQAALHTLGYTLSMSFVLPQVVSVVLMLTGARRQSLTDIVMGSAAINRPADGA
ncbi:MAG: RDD family protein [Gemmobacter sp.]|nr:RDD family protein [Gemmobacter sp.]